MFCYKCGAELTDGAIFCQKCGEKVVKEDIFQQSGNIDAKQNSVETSRPFIDQSQNISDNMVKTKKSKKKPVLFGIIIAFVLLVIFIAMNWEGKADYIASVKAYTPFAVSQNLPYTYEEVLNKYMEALEWKTRGDGEIHYIDVNGIAKGTDSELELTIKVSQNPDDPNRALIQPESVTIDRDLNLLDNDAVGFLIAMFSAYDESYSDLSKLLILMDLLEGKGEVELSETYINEDEGISFKYPAAWMPVSTIEDDVENDLGITVVGLANTLMPFQSFILVLQFPDNPLTEYLFINDDEFVANFSDEVSVIETSIGELDEVMVREISYIDSEDRYIQSYFYVVGTDLYRVDLACEEFHKEKFERIFDAIMESYSVDTLMMTNSDMYADLTESEAVEKDERSAEPTATDETVENLLKDPATKAQYEEAFASYEEQGMSVAVEAKGNDLVMSLTIQDAYLLTDETAVHLQNALEDDEVTSIFSELAGELDQFIGGEPGTCTYLVRYLDPDGKVLAEKSFKAK